MRVVSTLRASALTESEWWCYCETVQSARGGENFIFFLFCKCLKGNELREKMTPRALKPFAERPIIWQTTLMARALRTMVSQGVCAADCRREQSPVQDA